MSQKKIGIIHIIVGLDYGGAEKVVYDLIKCGNKEKFNFHVVSLINKTDRIEDFRALGIEPIICNLNIKTVGNRVKTLFELRGFIKEQKISIIHAHMYHGCLIAQFIKNIITLC